MYHPRSPMCSSRNPSLIINSFILLTSSSRLIIGELIIAVGLTGKSLFVVKRLLMKPIRRPTISLLSETGVFLLIHSPIISGGPLLKQLCLARVRKCSRLLLGVVDWCASQWGRLICSKIILTVRSLGSLLICCSLAIRLIHPTAFGRVRLCVFVRLGPL